MESLKLLSNGFFSKMQNKVSLDYTEDIEFTEDEIDEINIICDDYNFDINDLSILETLNGERNILQQHIITSVEYDNLINNYYVIYNRTENLLKVVISIYDTDFAEDSLVKFIEKFGKCIEIVINTEEEKNIILEQLSKYCKAYGYKDLEDFYTQCYDSQFMVDKREVLKEIQTLER